MAPRDIYLPYAVGWAFLARTGAYVFYVPYPAGVIAALVTHDEGGNRWINPGSSGFGQNIGFDRLRCPTRNLVFRARLIYRRCLGLGNVNMRYL